VKRHISWVVYRDSVWSGTNFSWSLSRPQGRRAAARIRLTANRMTSSENEPVTFRLVGLNQLRYDVRCRTAQTIRHKSLSPSRTRSYNHMAVMPRVHKGRDVVKCSSPTLCVIKQSAVGSFCSQLRCTCLIALSYFPSTLGHTWPPLLKPSTWTWRQHHRRTSPLSLCKMNANSRWYLEKHMVHAHI
jgi:hypothetical protein